jgi:diguanylate cyclase (GGDEF)-like protein
VTGLIAATITAVLVFCFVLWRIRGRILARIAQAALRDTLTGLPVRALFENRLDKAIARARRNGYTLGVLAVSIDRFQLVNDSLGQDHGDLLLRAVVERLRRCLRDEDTLSRFGKDEFVILLEQVEDATGAARVAERILSSLTDPFQLAGEDVVAAGSVGIAISERGTQPAADLVRDAQVAMRRAKEADSSRYEMFDTSMRASARQRLTLESDLRRALERDELTVRYQPLVSLASGEVMGAEALVRWQHPERGELLPAEFLAVAEQNGLIEPIGEWVLREACRVGSELHRSNGSHANVVMNVNLSVRQLRAGAQLVQKVAETLRATGLPPELLTLEITETVLVRERDPASATLDALRALGVGIAIDDFGTGYSSLAYLRYLPVSLLKVDNSFVADLRDGVDERIVKWMVSLGSAMDMPVCAEGVETKQQRDALIVLGCDLAQGYFFSRPVPEAELREAISRLRRQREGGFVRGRA